LADRMAVDVFAESAVPEAGETASQVAPDTVAVHAKLPDPVLLIIKPWLFGLGPPCAAVKLNDLWLRLNWGGVPLGALIFRYTGMS